MNQQEAAPAVPVGKIVSARRAAEILGRHVKTLESWRTEGKGPRYYQPEGKRGSVYYLEHEVISYALGGAR